MARFGRFGLAAVALALSVWGCGAPPPSATSRATRGNAVRAGTRPVQIAPIPRSDETLAAIVKEGAMIQAGLDTIPVQVREPEPGAQAAAVREAIRRDPPAIIVEAPVAADADLDAAVTEARAKGLLVVTLGGPLGEESAGPGREVVVVPAPFGPSASRIVELAMRNAAKGGLDPKSGALVVVRPDVDPIIADRLAALKEALAAAEVAKVDELAVGDDAKAAAAAVADAVKARPAVTLVLGADGAALAAADAATGILKTEHRYVVAGYTGDETSAKTQTSVGEYAAVGLYAHDRLFRKAVYLVAREIRGEKADDRVEIETTLLESPATAALPRSRVEPPPVDPLAPFPE